MKGMEVFHGDFMIFGEMKGVVMILL